ncbi:transposase-like protein [Branchiibius hedensis]|uniref:Transposase (Or an inactivated derivative) n=1 Tax=Branchiibius hedensis TaxID=672460 RepID=A0A2Y8ZRD5_9MICO|nr:transposase-like protein [Branchiibius hedensis]SSA34444.1 Transposase (or an inactivated derivative) [Branchiibius hedensis]
MTLQDMNDSTVKQPDATGSRGRKVPADRRPKASVLEQARREVIADLVRQARAGGEELTGPTGLLKELTKMVLEVSLEEEMTEHLGRGKHEPTADAGGDDGDVGRDGDQGSDQVLDGDVMDGRDGPIRNVRNGFRTKTVMTDNVGKVAIPVPRDRAGTFEPVIVAKHQRKLGSLDALVLSLTAKGLTTGEISAHLEEIYGASVSKDTISRITDRVSEEMDQWLARPLEAVYAAIFIDAIVVKVRDGQVANRPFYAAIGVTVDGCKDVLGLWAGTPGDGEGAKYWLSVLTELKNRGVTDTMFVVCDGLKGLPEVVETTWPDVIVQTCVIHLLRNSFRLTSRKYWDQIAKQLKLVYTAPSATAARAEFDTFAAAWGDRYPALIRLWDNAWEEFTPFLDYHLEVRRVLFSTNAIESLNARYRRAVRARGHFPNEQAALKCLYLVTRSLDPTGRGQARWTMRWKPALNAFATVFEGRWPTAEKY